MNAPLIAWLSFLVLPLPVLAAGWRQAALDRPMRLVVYWYQSHGRTVASEYWSKAYLVWDALRLNRTDGALVRVITPIDAHGGGEPMREKSVDDFVRAVYPALVRVLPG